MKMPLRPRRTLLDAVTLALGLGLWAASSVALAGGTRTEKIADFDDFDEGESSGAAIEGSGRLSVGYATTRAEVSDSRSVFTCLAEGDQLYLGTADRASVQRVTRGKKGPLVETLATLDGAVVSAMVALPGGDLVVATLPGGALLRVDRKGKVEAFATLDVERIWALQLHEGRLMVATGPRGELYSLSTDGKDAKVVLDVNEKDLLSLMSLDGALLVGTSPGAKLYRVSDELEGALVHDFAGDELRALVSTRWGLLAAVNEFKESQISSLKNLEKSLSRASITGEAPASTSTGATPVKADARLYHVDLRGDGDRRDLDRAMEAPWETWLDKSGQYFTDLLAVDDAGTVLVSSSHDGKIYRVRGRRDVATIGDLEERQATALCATRQAQGRGQGRAQGGGLDQVIAGAGDGAAVYQLSAAPAAEAAWTSTVYDAEQPATYGAVRVLARGKLSLEVRAGPSDEPDERWGPWRQVTLRGGPAGLEGQLGGPRRRYIQLRVKLLEADAELREIEFFYAPENLAPKISSVSFTPPKFSKSDDTEPKPKGKVSWKVEAVDEDDLAFGVRIRNQGAGDDEWVPLHEALLITEKELEVDLTTLPDGVYELELVATDEPSNGAARARRDELRSEPVVVDRTRPIISALRVEGDRVLGTATDEATHIHDVAFAIDGGDFRAASPADGMFDARSEDFAFTLQGVRPGTHRLVVRARDARGNLTTQALVVRR